MEENSLSSVEEISQADWEKTPESMKRLVKSLIGRIEQLERQYEELKAENQLLKEQVKQTSRNSSKPPSQDISKGFKAKEQKPGQKKPGAQLGHVGHERPLYPIEQCQSVEDHYPDHCIECGEPLTGNDSEPYRIQRVELPQIDPQVSEHRFHCLQCERCGGYTRAWDEGLINGSGYGAGLIYQP